MNRSPSTEYCDGLSSILALRYSTPNAPAAVPCGMSNSGPLTLKLTVSSLYLVLPVTGTNTQFFQSDGRLPPMVLVFSAGAAMQPLDGSTHEKPPAPLDTTFRLCARRLVRKLWKV
ncbi:hypothetical protein D9M71_661000 [compost metagenome]